MTQGAPTAVGQTRTTGRVAAGDHTCLLYDDPAEQAPVLAPFIREALESGERVIYVADDLTIEEVAGSLVSCGIDVQPERDRGALLLWDRHDWRTPGAVDIPGKCAQVQEIVTNALAEGFRGVAFAIEMTWTLGPDIEADPLGTCEATLDSLFSSDLPIRMVCQYSRARLAPSLIRAALMTHPVAILDGHLSTNPYYVEPRQWIDGPAPTETVPADHRADWMLARIRSARLLAEERDERLRAEAALAAADVTRGEIAAEAELFATLHRVGQIVLSELDEQVAIQAVTDLVVPAVGAQFGAFFQKAPSDETDEPYLLQSLASGADHTSFDATRAAHAAELFDATFRDNSTIRITDIGSDPRFAEDRIHPALDGSPAPRSYLAVPVIGRSGEVHGGLFFWHEAPGVFSDRDARLVEGVAAQAAIAIENGRLYAEAQAAITAREQFLGVASHELKTPLTVLKGYALLLERKVQRNTLNPADLPAIVGQLVTHSRRLEALVNDLLETSRIQRGRLELRREQADLTAVTREVLERIAQGIDRRETHRFQVEAESPILGWFDPSRIDQVLTNLLGNAIKYSPDGGDIRVVLRTQDGWAELAITDQGIGIPEEAHGSLFQPFFRVYTEGDPFGGTGLGLYISDQIVDAHGGSIGVDSRLGTGSTFVVRLPLQAPPTH